MTLGLTLPYRAIYSTICEAFEQLHMLLLMLYKHLSDMIECCL